jgi:hypothetical protein
LKSHIKVRLQAPTHRVRDLAVLAHSHNLLLLRMKHLALQGAKSQFVGRVVRRIDRNHSGDVLLDWHPKGGND